MLWIFPVANLRKGCNHRAQVLPRRIVFRFQLVKVEMLLVPLTNVSIDEFLVLVAASTSIHHLLFAASAFAHHLFVFAKCQILSSANYALLVSGKYM